MFTMSPFYIPAAVFFGGILAPILGWAAAYRDSKKAPVVPGAVPPTEPFDWKREFASAIIAAIAAIIIMGQYAAAISVGLPDLEIAFIAGFGADKIVKNAIGI